MGNGFHDLTAMLAIKATRPQTGEASLPAYWESYLPSKIAAIKALQDAGGKDAFSFVVMSDIHYPTNLGKRSPAIAKRVMDECDIRYALVLGDLQNSGVHSTYDATREEWDAIHTMFAPLMKNALFQRGNHDGSWGAALSDGTTYPYNFRPEELYALIHAKTYANHNAVTDESGTGYYVDDASRKVRYVMLNTHCNEYAENADGSAVYNNMSHARYTQSQYDLLVEALKTLKGGWSVLVASHVPPNGAYNDAFGGDGTTGDNVIMQGLLRAFKNKTAYKGSWSGTAGGGGGYTNLFSASGSGFKQESDTKFLTNWLPYNPNDNGGKGTIYHFKGLLHNSSYSNPYKFHFAEDENGTYYDGSSGTSLAYCTNGNQKANVTADYDGSVILFQHLYNTEPLPYIQFEIREALPENLIITANEEIIGDGSSEGGYDAVSVDVDFSDAKGELIGYFSGHMHKDYVYAAADYFGFNIVTTACDTDLNTSVTKTAGTVTEQSFDVFTVNRKTRTVYATKIGAGEDRVIQY